MKNLFGKFAVAASLVILSLTSCEKEDTQTGSSNSYTTFEVSNVTLLNKDVTVEGRIGEKLLVNNKIPKIQISRTDEAGKKAVIYTFENVDITSTKAPIIFKAKAAYGNSANMVYDYSTTFPLLALGKGVKGSTTITLDLWDATKIVSTCTTTNVDYNIKL
jgi:hypothetical protein